MFKRRIILNIVVEGGSALLRQSSFALKNGKRKLVFAEECISAMESNDRSRRLAHYALKIADALDLDYEQRENIRLLCYCYDLGKIFDDYQREDVIYFSQQAELENKHTEIGAAIAQCLPQLYGISEAIRYHHEKWDGSGLYGLQGEQIPLSCRVFSVCWAYDKMIRPGGGRVGMILSDALTELEQFAGRELDPSLISLFQGLLNEKPKGALHVKPKMAFSFR